MREQHNGRLTKKEENILRWIQEELGDMVTERSLHRVALGLCKETQSDFVAITRQSRKKPLIVWRASARTSRRQITRVLSTMELPTTVTGRVLPSARASLALLTRLGIEHHMVFPLHAGRLVLGSVIFGSEKPKPKSERIYRYAKSMAEALSATLVPRELEYRHRMVETRYDELFENIADGVVVIERASKTIRKVNSRLLHILAESRSTLPGRQVMSLFVREEQKDIAHCLDAGYTKDPPRLFHLETLTGRKVPIRLGVIDSSDEAERILILHDMTEQQRVDVKLAASEDLLRIIFEGMLDTFFYVHNTQGVFTYVSPSVKDVTGRSVEEWMRHYTRYLTSNPLNADVHEYTERAIKEGITAPPYICEVYHANGEPILLEVNEKPVFREGRVIAVQGVARDITERQRWEQNLLDSEERYRLLFDSVRDGIFQSDAEGSIHRINKSGAIILAYESPSEIVETGVRWPDLFVREDDRRRVLNDIRRDGYVEGFEFLGRKKNGELCYLEGSGAASFGDNGQILRYDGTFRDITERKRLEEQLLQSQKMESIGLLAGGIAHDFNNILTGVLGYTSFMKPLVASDAKLSSYLDTVERSALRAADLTSKLLAFARRGKYNVKPIDLNDIVLETLGILRGSIDSTVEIVVTLEENIPAIAADASQIQQVLMNLCVNARDAMPSGGRLSIATSLVTSPDGELASQPDAPKGAYIKACVADTGTGIDASLLSRVFEPFFTTKPQGKGTGLGLATVYGIVKNHGGYIFVDSTLGSGTTFRVYFPAVDRKAMVMETEKNILAGGNERILIVDDEIVIRRLARDVLESFGYTVLEAEDGEHALSVYQKEGATIDLIILDMAMPVMGGREAFLRLKELNPKIKVILSTGYAEDDRALEMLEQGVKAFVQKPYRVEEFARAIRQVLDAKNAD